jgi:hypothetical protein
MVYDPSGKSRIVIGVFPRGSPLTATSAFAGVDRISKFPCAALAPARAGGLAVTPAAGRDGIGGGGGALAARLSRASGTAAGGAGCAPAGSSTVVSATVVFVFSPAAGGAARRPMMKKYASASQTTMTLTTRMEKNRRGPFTSENTGVC